MDFAICVLNPLIHFSWSVRTKITQLYEIPIWKTDCKKRASRSNFKPPNIKNNSFNIISHLERLPKIINELSSHLMSSWTEGKNGLPYERALSLGFSVLNQLWVLRVSQIIQNKSLLDTLVSGIVAEPVLQPFLH